MTQEAPAIERNGAPAEKSGAIFLAKMEESDHNPFLVVCELLFESGYPITLEPARSARGEEQPGMVSVSVATRQERQATLDLMKDARVQAIYTAVSGAGVLKLEDCGWDQETEKVVGGTFWHNSGQLLRSFIGYFYKEVSANNKSNQKRLARLKMEAEQSERKAKSKLRGQTLTGEQIRELILPVVTEFVDS